jgi:threonine dehydrogenase-like Zn-dependent dehydrogenase
VLLRIEGCGVCGSDLPAWEGRPWFDYPLAPGAPGHEPWGIVEELGPGVTGPPPGTRVAALSYNAYAERDLADAAAIVPLPCELEGMPFPGEAIGCAVNVFRRSDIRAGHTVAVVGVGFLGALLVQLAANAGARVIALSRRGYALEVASRMGAGETLRLAEDSAQQVERLNDGRLCERVIECTGTQRGLDVATALAGVRARLVVAGFHQDGRRSVDMQRWNWQGLDVVNAHERDPRVYVEGMREAVRAVVAGRLDPRPLVTHRFGLERLGEALETARRRPDGFLKAVVVP